MATTSRLVFRNRDCLSLFVSSNTTLLGLQTLLFLFFPNSMFPNWGCGLSKDAAYTLTFTVLDFIILLSLNNDILEASKRHAMLCNILSQIFIVNMNCKEFFNQKNRFKKFITYQ